MRIVLPTAEWQPIAAAYSEQVKSETTGVKGRKQNVVVHPVDDFMWDYYHLRPNQLAKWHPGFFVELEDAAEQYGNSRGYELLPSSSARASADFVLSHMEQINNTISLLEATMERPARTGCFGLHEWAMIYGLEPSEIRHEATPLRLTVAEIKDVVDSHQINCSHYDAFRFFTKAAEPKNKLQPSRLKMIDNEQPGCLHANMDVYKWGFKLLPLVTSDFVFRAFLLAREIRRLDMQAAPYDFTDWNLPAVKVETPEGKAIYIEHQLKFAERANELRRELIAQLTAIKKFLNVD
jgi:hypothetical protein